MRRSRIDKLAILGVRSFDNRRSETIQFHTPLTLIVGYNGSGKTTIIECLKYATTGELPPNSKGGAFIHDPQMCREKEVLAQVKLSFKSGDGAKLVCTRSLQLTLDKSNKRSQKSLEAQLLVVKNGERSTLSSRCADLNGVMLQYLGVSRAVLDNVIFCHQDESLWPMSEPATLKKKFDEIFEALKYTKAIKSIKDLIKKQKDDLAKQKILLDQYKIDKDRAERAEKKAKELHDQVETMRDQIHDLDADIASTLKEAKEFFNTASGFEATIATLNGKRQQVVTMQENIEDLAKNLEEVEESDEELLILQRDYEVRMRAFEDQIKANHGRQMQVTADLAQARRSLEAKLTDQGKAAAEKQAFERQVARRQDLVKEAARRHSIRGFDMDLDEGLLQDFMQRLNRMYKDQSAVLERVKRETREELTRAQEELNRISNQKSSLAQRKDYARNEVRNSEAKLLALQRKLDEMHIDEGQEAMQQSILDGHVQSLEKIKDQFNKAEYEKKIRTINSELREVEEESQYVTAELGQSTRQADDRAKLGILKKEQETRKSALETLLAANRDKLDHILGEGWNINAIERELQTVIETRDEELADLNRQRDGVNQDISQVEAKISLAREATKEKRQTMKEYKKKIELLGDEINVENYLEKLKLATEYWEKVQEDGSQGKNMAEYLNLAITTAHTKGVCALCSRRFDPHDQPEFVKKLELMVKKLMDEEVLAEIEAMKEDVEALQNHRPIYDNYCRLRDEIPALDADLLTNTEKQERYREQLEKVNNECTERGYAKAEAESLRRPVLDISRYRKELEDYRQQIRKLSTQLQEVGGSRTIDDMQAKLQELGEKAQSLRSQVTNITTERDRHRQQIVMMENDLRDSREKLTSIKHQLETSHAMVEQMQEYRDMIKSQQKIIIDADQEIGALLPQVTTAQAKVNDITEQGTEKEKRLQRDASKLFDSLTQLRTADDEINHYLQSGKANYLERCIRDVENLQKQVEALQAEAAATADLVLKAQQETANAKNTEQKITNNLRYRQNKRNLDALLAEIEELEEQDAESARDRFQRDAKRMQDKHMRLSTQRSEIAGSMKSKDNELAHLMTSFEVDFKDAKTNFRASTVKVQTTKAAIDDLTKYSTALDKAVMKYHSLKMEEINRIIDELWKATYRGTDVDTVMIRSEGDDTKGNRSYNYRVCMVKQDAELDMRGRCSAGQKVLACIIIRLALAECFGVNCGLIALDEPTTNLDRDNIKSLARSLAQIIQTRQKQSNFQLIVITHDEDFLRYMNCSDFCDHYYRVSRDDRQKSIIERQSISEVF